MVFWRMCIMVEKEEKISNKNNNIKILFLLYYFIFFVLFFCMYVCLFVLDKSEECI